MSSRTINFTFKVDGVLTDVTSLKLSDPTGAFGARRQDTGDIIVADGTDWSHDSTGQYSYELTDLVPDKVYEYWIERVYGGVTKRQERTFTAASAASELPTYVTVEECAAMVAAMLNVPSLVAATTERRIAALEAATCDIDSAMRYQGRRYDSAQALEFPRIPFDDDVVWDWNIDSSIAVVPLNVKRATVYQAEEILSGARNAKQKQLAKGVTAKSTGGLSETFGGSSNGDLMPLDMLCPRSLQIMRKYKLSTGKLR